ncbi:MAG: acyltransferase family protein [Proteobacteria bacterium]|nr:acyltransferase family protein [Pseudomonadota bacterium]
MPNDTQPPDQSDSVAPTSDGADQDSAVPDAAVPESDWAGASAQRESDPGDSGDFVILGGEAVVPQRDYGPPIESVLPDPERRKREIRELERRVRERLTPAFPIEQRRHLPLEFLWRRYRQLAMQSRSDVVDEFGRDPIVLSRFEPLLNLLYTSYFRVEATGIAHVPDTGRAIIVANHAGTLPYDGVMIMQAMRREHPGRRDARPLVEDFIFHFPYLGTLINRIGGVRACPENAERLLASDQVIIVFPEGQKGTGKLFRDRYRLQRFGRGGFVKLALRTRSPIIPVAVVGAEESMPILRKVTWLTKSLNVPYIPITPTFPILGPLGLVPVPSKWYLIFGPAIDLAADYGPERADDRLLVNKLAEQVRSTIQSMVDGALKRRKSVVRG